MNIRELNSLKSLVSYYNAIVYSYTDEGMDNTAFAVMRREIEKKANELCLDWAYTEFPMIKLVDAEPLDCMSFLADTYGISDNLRECLEVKDPVKAVNSMVNWYNYAVSQDWKLKPEWLMKLANSFKYIKACAELVGMRVCNTEEQLYIVTEMEG